MDIGAYVQIDNLREIAEKNNIDVPRLRGYRLMKDETPISREDTIKSGISNGLSDCAGVIRSKRGGFGLVCHEYSERTDRLIDRYMVKEKRVAPNGFEYYDVVGIKWDAVHGKLRKKLKFAMKKARKRIVEQNKVFNKYAGRDDVLYVHARIGGNNWLYYGGAELEKQPWFLEMIDDSFDDTYCDIYAQIKSLKEGANE